MLGLKLGSPDEIHTNTKPNVPEPFVQTADQVVPQLSSECFKFQLFTPLRCFLAVSINSSPPLKSHCRLAADKHSLLQGLKTTIPCDHCTFHIPRNCHACSAIDTLWLLNVSLQMCLTPNFQVLRTSTQGPSSTQHSPAHVLASALDHFTSNHFRKQFSQQKFMACYQARP